MTWPHKINYRSHCEERLRRSRRVGKGALVPCPPSNVRIRYGGHASLCPPYEAGLRRFVSLAMTSNKNKSAKPRWPLEHSIPEFPTKVGGHHVAKSTDLARDSSRKDR